MPDFSDFYHPFLLRALLAGLALALAVGPLGCLVVWRRMAYFGDSLAHSALLGVVLGMVTGIGTHPGIVVVCALFAALLVWLQQKRWLATDTLLGILAHAALSCGMIALSLMHRPGFDISAYLFGDLLGVSWQDVGVMGAGALLTLCLLLSFWQPLVLMCLHEDLARAEGVRLTLMQLALMCMMTLVVAGAISLVGMLLITSLMIIPAATARLVSRSPESMALLAAAFGVLSVLGGLVASVLYDVPTGPAIVCASSALFAGCIPASWLAGYAHRPSH